MNRPCELLSTLHNVSEYKRFLQEHKQRNEEAWSKGYHLFPEVLRSRDAKIGVEVGVAYGGHSEAILGNKNVQKLFGIDSYQHFDDYKDGMNLDQPLFDLAYEQTCKRLSKFGDRFELIRAKSLEAIGLINESLDFVYIDADHSYEGCLKDIINWFTKVREGGIIGGHDYNSSIHPDVTVVVDLFFGNLGWEVHCEGHGCWWVEKQQIDTNDQIWLLISQFWWKCCIGIKRTSKGLRRILGRSKRFVLFIFSKIK